MPNATADQVAAATSHIRNVLRLLQDFGGDLNAGQVADGETELGKALTALGEQPVTESDHSHRPNLWHDIGKAATEATEAVSPVTDAAEAADGN